MNPDHLFVGTAKDNAHDMREKGRAHDGSSNLARCTNRFAAKLTEEQVRLMREKAADGVAPKELAKEFSTHVVNVRLIIRGKTWQGV